MACRFIGFACSRYGSNPSLGARVRLSAEKLSGLHRAHGLVGVLASGSQEMEAIHCVS